MIRVICGDITKLDVDAVVNAANTQLAPGGGVDGAIRRVGGHELNEAISRLGSCPVGEARLTLGFHLPARYVIHTVAPIWHGGDASEAELLASCYRSVFRIAMDNDMRSIAFPCLGTGAFGYPKQEAAEIAFEQMESFENRFAEIIVCCHEQEDEKIYLELASNSHSNARR